MERRGGDLARHLSQHQAHNTDIQKAVHVAAHFLRYSFGGAGGMPFWYRVPKSHAGPSIRHRRLARRISIVRRGAVPIIVREVQHSQYWTVAPLMSRSLPNALRVPQYEVLQPEDIRFSCLTLFGAQQGIAQMLNGNTPWIGNCSP